MAEPKVTIEQLDLMRHTVGLDRSDNPYRNYFSADEGHTHWNSLIELVEMGLMTKRKSTVSSDTIFHITNQGCWFLNIPGTEELNK